MADLGAASWGAAVRLAPRSDSRAGWGPHMELPDEARTGLGRALVSLRTGLSARLAETPGTCLKPGNSAPTGQNLDRWRALTGGPNGSCGGPCGARKSL